MSNNRWFQWVAGDKRSQVVVFDSIVAEEGEVYINFKDGSRINEKFVAEINQKDLSGKLMAEIDHPDNCWRFVEKNPDANKPHIETDWESQTNYEIPSLEEVANADLTGSEGITRQTKKTKKIIELVPPRPTPKNHSVFGKIDGIVEMPAPVYVPLPVPQQEVQNLSHVNDPVFILMSKSKKLDGDVNINMTISLPPKNLYDLAKESFENGDEKFIEYIVNEITTDSIKAALATAIKNMYEEIRT